MVGVLMRDQVLTGSDQGEVVSEVHKPLVVIRVLFQSGRPAD